VRTAAEGVSADELRRDVEQLLEKWRDIDEKAKRLAAPSLLYSEPQIALRAIREELNEEYLAGSSIDDPELFELVRTYVGDIDPALADRVEFYDEALRPCRCSSVTTCTNSSTRPRSQGWLPSGVFAHHRADRGVWVIDVNTGRNVGSSNLEETVFRNNSKRRRRSRANFVCATSAGSSSSTSSTWR